DQFRTVSRRPCLQDPGKPVPSARRSPVRNDGTSVRRKEGGGNRLRQLFGSARPTGRRGDGAGQRNRRQRPGGVEGDEGRLSLLAGYGLGSRDELQRRQGERALPGAEGSLGGKRHRRLHEGAVQAGHGRPRGGQEEGQARKRQVGSAVDFAFSDEQIILRDSVRKMMDRLATPDYVRRLDREQAYPDALYAAWVEMGLLRLPFAEEYGGLGGSALDMVVLADEMARKSFDFFTAYGGSVFCGLNVARKGSQEQKSYWLPKLLSGEIKMSISMSEPDAGSDLGSMRTAARRDGDEWIINGRKIW